MIGGAELCNDIHFPSVLHMSLKNTSKSTVAVLHVTKLQPLHFPFKQQDVVQPQRPTPSIGIW